jgi:oxygen-dependent protoporphyrinogen oxidase
MSGKKVIVVGAGCAGLMAAHTLRKHGVDVIVLEASEFIGGRCRNYVKNGYNIACGAGVTEPQCKTTYKICQEMGIADEMIQLKTPKVGFYRNGKAHYLLVSGGIKDHLKNLPETLRFRGIPFAAYPQIAKLLFALMKRVRGCDAENVNFDSLLDLGNTSAYDFALQHGGPEAVASFTDIFLNCMVLSRSEYVTISHIIALLAYMEGISTMKRGMGSLTEGLYEIVKDSVSLSTPVKKIVIEGKKVKGVETQEGFIDADQVICATDAVIAQQIMPELPDTMRKPLETCKYSSTYSYTLCTRERVTPDNVIGLSFRRSDDPKFSAIFEASGFAEGVQPPGSGILVAFTAGWLDNYWGRFTPEEREKAVIKEVQKYFPKLPGKPDLVEAIRWDRAINLESPGQFPAIHELLKSHMRDVKGLYLAGEYLFIIASTEGAFATGEKAANMVIEDGS